MNTSRLLLAASIATLGGGCSVLYESDPRECVVEDEDGDGVLSLVCGGRDCDDRNDAAFPGATEVCDPEADDGTDEDCNPATIGVDADGDGYYDEDCFNVDATGLLVSQGNDCDDTDPAIHIGVAEVCNGLDDDCDEEIDEGLGLLEFYPDCDGDGFGDDSALVELDCDTPVDAPDCGEGVSGVWLRSGGDCDDQDAARWSACGSCAAVDVLFVIDTSNSMVEEQAALAEQLPLLVRVLGSGDRDRDGVRDFQPIEDLQVGVVTPDLGVGPGNAVPTCDAAGDDAILLRDTGSPSPECRARADALADGYLTFSATEDRAAIADFTANWSCLVQAGGAGCGFEQHLEASLKAVTPARSTLRFGPAMTLGHGDGANRGFVRPDSLLVVVVVSDEDDCSVQDYRLFDTSGGGPYAGTDLNLRCVAHEEALHPIDRYVSGLLQLRRAQDLVFGVVSGIPITAAPEGGAGGNWQGMLEHPAMQIRTSPSDPTRLEPACMLPRAGSAAPARRLVRLAQELDHRGARTVVSSICSPTAYATIAAAILTAAEAASVERCDIGG